MLVVGEPGNANAVWVEDLQPTTHAAAFQFPSSPSTVPPPRDHQDHQDHQDHHPRPAPTTTTVEQPPAPSSTLIIPSAASTQVPQLCCTVHVYNVRYSTITMRVPRTLPLTRPSSATAQSPSSCKGLLVDDRLALPAMRILDQRTV